MSAAEAILDAREAALPAEYRLTPTQRRALLRLLADLRADALAGWPDHRPNPQIGVTLGELVGEVISESYLAVTQEFDATQTTDGENDG